MNIILKIKEFIKKLQGLPLSQRKLILLVIVIILGIVLLFFWVGSIKSGLSELKVPEVPDQVLDAFDQAHDQIIDTKQNLEDLKDDEALQELERQLQEEEQNNENVK